MAEIRSEHFPLKDETEAIIHLAFEVYDNLGSGFLEIVYKDALMHEFNENDIEFEREKEYTIRYKDILLNHRFYADFVVFDSVILEVKAKQGITNEDIAQMINYLKCSGCQVGLILNFAKNKLEIKRVIF